MKTLVRRLKNAGLALAGKNTDCTITGVFFGKFHSIVFEDGKIARMYIGKGSAIADFYVEPVAKDSNEFKKHVAI